MAMDARRTSALVPDKSTDVGEDVVVHCLDEVGLVWVWYGDRGMQHAVVEW